MFPTATTADGRKCSIHNLIDRRGRNGNSAIQQESQAGSHAGMGVECVVVVVWHVYRGNRCFRKRNAQTDSDAPTRHFDDW